MKRKSSCRATAAILGVGTLFGFSVLTFAPGVAADPGYVHFRSPSGNIGCEINFQRPGVANGVYCDTNSPPRNVKMDASGSLEVCEGINCLSNGPLNNPILSYGQSVGAGPYNCSSEMEGITCTAAMGRGFTISSSGISRVG